MTRRRKGLVALLSVLLVLVLSAGLTLAYLTGDAGEATNVFTFSDNIRGRLDEPNWEEVVVTPGMELRKDPMITNTSDNGLSEYVSIMVTFEPGADASYDGDALSDNDTARLLSLIDIDWNTDSWTLVGAYDDGGNWVAVADDQSNLATVQNMNNQVWIYNSELAPGEVTDPLYNTVTIHSVMDDEDMTWLSGTVLDHTDDCWEFGNHDDLLCEITYKHHANCAVDSGLAETSEKGENGCDCTPAEQHEEACPSLEGTLKGGCGHTAGDDTICGFQITNSGALVQASEFESATASATIAAFATLFDPANI